MQELVTSGVDYIGYWTNERSTSEIDFLIQQQGSIIPIEVKSGNNLRSRSFTLFCQANNPDCALKTSPLPFHSDTNVQNVPLYGLSSFLKNREIELSLKGKVINSSVVDDL